MPTKNLIFSKTSYAIFSASIKSTNHPEQKYLGKPEQMMTTLYLRVESYSLNYANPFLARRVERMLTGWESDIFLNVYDDVEVVYDDSVEIPESSLTFYWENSENLYENFNPKIVFARALISPTAAAQYIEYFNGSHSDTDIRLVVFFPESKMEELMADPNDYWGGSEFGKRGSLYFTDFTLSLMIR